MYGFSLSSVTQIIEKCDFFVMAHARMRQPFQQAAIVPAGVKKPDPLTGDPACFASVCFFLSVEEEVRDLVV
ncbi:hypothetical protein, partial [Faecalibaculum rodentium]|uniref:hypothetical protein n=1 Tax=Faecalibaculum rodentium TaxID=1702221 RepID=UPI0026EE9084